MRLIYLEYWHRTMVKGVKIRVEEVLRYTPTEEMHFGEPRALYTKIYVWFFGRLLMISIKKNWLQWKKKRKLRA